MSVVPLQPYALPLMAERSDAPRALTPKGGRELRRLQRRLAAARLGVGCPQKAGRQPLYEDLR